MLLETLKHNSMFQLVCQTEWHRFESAEFVSFVVRTDCVRQRI